MHVQFLVFGSCAAALAHEPIGYTAPAAQTENISGIVVSAENIGADNFYFKSQLMEALMTCF